LRVIPIHDYAALTPDQRAELEAVVPLLRTLGDALEWARAQTPPWSVAEIVTQDEYTHDVVLESSGRPFLAFDTS
jgi:hypothetical protein